MTITNQRLGTIWKATLASAAMLLICAAPAPAAKLGLGAAKKAAHAKIAGLDSFQRLAELGAPGPLRAEGCKRLRSGRVRCTAYRTAYRPCADGAGQQAACVPLTRVWTATVAARRSGKARITRIRFSDRAGYAGPCAGGPCVKGEQASGGSTIDGAARAAVLAHPTFANIIPPDPSGSRLVTHSCSGVGGDQSECLLYREVADPCHLQGSSDTGQLCIQVLVYRNWVVRVTGDPQDPQLFTAVVQRYWDAGQPPAK